MLTPTQGSFTFPNHKDQTIIKFVDLVCAALKKICEKSDRSIKTGESGGGSEVDLGPDDVAVQRLVLVHLHNHPHSHDASSWWTWVQNLQHRDSDCE